MKKPPRIFYGWWIVVAGSAIIFVGGFHFHGTTVFFLPLADGLGLSRGALSLIFAISRLEGGVEGPIVGWLIDRFGERRVIIGGAILAGVGYVVLATLVKGFWSLLLVYTLLVSIGTGAGTWAPAMAAANRWFIRRRTMAMSIISIFNRVAAFLVVPLLSLVVLNLGWQVAALMVGAVLMAVMLAMALVMRPSPESMGLSPDGDRAIPSAFNPKPTARPSSPPHSTRQHEFSIKEATKTPAFWLIILAQTTRVMVTAAMTIQIIPVLVWKGLTRQGAANMVGIMWATSILSVLVLGWAGDRFTKRTVVALSSFIGALGIALLLFGHQTGILFIGLVLFAANDAAWSVILSMTSEYFGRRNFATIRGSMQFFSAPASFFATFMTGWIYDKTESYALALAGLTIIAALSVPLYLACVPPKPPRPITTTEDRILQAPPA